MGSNAIPMCSDLLQSEHSLTRQVREEADNYRFGFIPKKAGGGDLPVTVFPSGLASQLGLRCRASRNFQTKRELHHRCSASLIPRIAIPSSPTHRQRSIAAASNSAGTTQFHFLVLSGHKLPRPAAACDAPRTGSQPTRAAISANLVCDDFSAPSA